LGSNAFSLDVDKGWALCGEDSAESGGTDRRLAAHDQAPRRYECFVRGNE
jgi:hypothetical protein